MAPVWAHCNVNHYLNLLEAAPASDLLLAARTVVNGILAAVHAERNETAAEPASAHKGLHMKTVSSVIWRIYKKEFTMFTMFTLAE